MRRKIVVALGILSMMLAFTACHFSLDSILPEKKQVVCQITQKDGQTLTVVVQSPDQYYETDETLIVKYRTITGGNSLDVGDQVTFSYDYLNDVTVQSNLPCITVDTVTKTIWTPSETEATEPSTLPQ